MRPEQKTKSRAKLYDAISGTKEMVGTAGLSSTWTIAFAELAANGDTVTVGDYVFQFVTDGGEDTPGDSAGTAADPHLITIGGTPTATTAAASLVAALLAEDGTGTNAATTGAWGYLHPDDSIGASNSTGTVTVNFWPGTVPNAAGYISVSQTGTDATVTNTQTGVTAPSISKDVNMNVIDTTGFGTDNVQYYDLKDGDYVGQQVGVLVETVTTSDVPTILGHFVTLSGVTASMNASGDMAEFTWNGSAWRENIGDATGDVTYVAAA